VPDEAILIYDYEDLKKIGNDPGFPLDGYYVQMGDIDASASREENNGEGFAPIGPNEANSFRGTFDGSGHTIRGLYINRPNTSGVGLFGYVGVTISTFFATITGVNILADTITGRGQVGGLIGATRSSIITNCSVRGRVVGASRSHFNTGGLVGSSIRSTITGSYSAGSVSSAGSDVGGLVGFCNSRDTIRRSYSTANVSGAQNWIGGLIGRTYSGNTIQIAQCFATGSVYGTGREVGGLVGSNGSIITESYSTGAVTSDSTTNIGGLVGVNSDNLGATVTSSYWNIVTSGQSSRDTDWGTGLPTAQMQQRSTYTNWDFVDVWAIDEGQGYPFLRSLGRPVYYHDNQPSPSPQANSPAASVSRTTGTPGTPNIALRGRTLSVVSPAVNSNLQIRVVDLRGRTVARFNTVTTSTNSRFPLNNLSAGRYLVEVRDINNKRVNVSPIMVR